MVRVRPAARLLSCLLIGVSVSGCSLLGGGPDNNTSPAGSGAEVVLVTHDSWALPQELITDFEERSGFSLRVEKSGDAGSLTNQLVLTAGSPEGDLAYGVDNTFASRALDAGVFQAADVSPIPGAAAYALAEGGDSLLAIDSASVCINIDKTWFAQRRLAPPRTLDDLTKPSYRDLLVVPGAPTSSPGMAFLLATIARYGDAWPDYWADLMGNGVKLTSGWSDAYYVDFTQGGGHGKRPLVLSYDSSPAFTVANGRTSTKALPDTCFEQVEYAGVLAGAKNPEGARALLRFLGSAEVQAALPDSMYVFPVRAGVALPPAWARFAPRPPAPATLDPAEIAAHRDEWLTTWTEVTTR